MRLNIRARLNLEVAKFKANTKIVASQFRAMSTGAKRFSDNVDHYAKRSIKTTQQINAQRVQDTSRTGQAILAREKQIANDRYSVIMQAARKAARDKSKLELDAVRNRGGIRPGTNVGRNLGLEAKQQKEISAMARMSAKERARYERELAKQFKAMEKEKLAAAKARLKRQTELEKAWAKNDKALLKDILSAYKSGAKERVAAEKAALKEISRANKEEAARQNRLATNAIKHARAQQKAREAAAKQTKKLEADSIKSANKAQLANWFNSKKFERQMAGARYALYDISRRAAGFGAAIAGAFALAAREAIKFESAFTSVERTTQLSLQSNIPEVKQQADELRDSLIQMSLEIPVAFEDVTKAATLGAQLGIAADAVDGFSETVIKFAAITGISVDEVGMSFGRLAQLLDVPVSQFENLSSAITFTGINSVATDREILRMAESIGAAGYQAGLSADEVVGFSSALASLKVRPEEARGVFTRLFRTFDIEASLASERMEDFAAMMGRTTEQATSLYKNDPTEFFKQFLYGANATGELNVAMKELGINNTRELNVITRLAGNMGVLEEALADSREQYLLGTYSGEAFAQVVDDVASRIQIMQNSVSAMAAALGEQFMPFIAGAADFIASLAKNISNMSPVGKFFIAFVGAAVAGISLFYAALTAGIAGLLALKFAFKALAVDGAKANISIGTFTALARSMFGASTQATAGVVGLSGGLKVLGISMKSLPGIGLVLTLAGIAAALIDFGFTAANSSEKMKELGQAGLEAGGGLSEAMEAIARDADLGNKAIGRFNITMSEEEKQISANKKAYLEMADAHDKRTKSQGKLPEAFDKTTGSIEDNTQAILDNKDAQAGPSGGVDVDETLAIEQGEEYVKWLALGARKYAKEDGSTGDILAEMLEFGIGTDAESMLTKLGFDYMEMYEAAVADAAKDGAGAQAYADAFDASFTTSLDAIAFKAGTTFSDRVAQAVKSGEITAETGAVFQQMFDQSGLSMQDFFSKIRVIPGAFDEAALAADSVNTEVKKLATADAIEKTRNSAAGLTEDIEDAAEAAEDLKDVLNELFSAQLTENAAADAFDSLIGGLEGTKGEMLGLESAARENFGNFTSFIKSASEAANAAGEGTSGALARIIEGLYGISDAGYETAEAFDVAKGVIVQSLIEINPQLAELYTELSGQKDLAGIESVVRGFYAVKMAAATTLSQAISFSDEMNRILDSLVVSGSRYVFSATQVQKSTEKTLTALEKLQAAIAKVFSSTNSRIAVQDSINSLGDSLRENGRTFSVWSERGRGNVESLFGAIDALAESSGGDLQKFANQLGTLRAALVKAGAPASALKYIDDALKSTGKTAKVSTKEVNRFYKELTDNNSAKRSLAEIASAVGEVQSALKSSISAYFAQQRAVDDITLGWYDMADAADAASKAVASAQSTIDDANQSIIEANASIKELQAEGKTLEYQLQIAVKYGDELRAEEIRAQIASINADIAGERDNITDANRTISEASAEMAEAQGNLGLKPTTKQMIEQSRALEDMALKYADATAWMLVTAKEGDDLNKIIEDQVTKFENNAKQMGYSEKEAKRLGDILRTELKKSMDDIPKDITTNISAETGEALSKVTQFAKDANSRLATIKDKTVTVTTKYIEQIVPGRVGGMSANPTHWLSAGGYVAGPGSSTSDSIPARLSNGEYVIKAAAVSRYGVDFFNALNQMQAPRMSSASVAASVSSGSQTVYLSTEDRNLLRQAIDRPIALYTDNATIAKSANDGNALLAQRGIR